MNSESLQSVSGVASITSKLDERNNEDMADVLQGVEPSCHAIALADGLGSYVYPREAAKFVIAQAKSLSKACRLDSTENLTDLFIQIRHDLREYVRNLPTPPPSEAFFYGTTLLIAVETPTHLIVAYTGNGGIWHLPGNFDESTGPDGIPWSSVNYLRPHSTFDNGKEKLYNLIDFSDAFDGLPPTVITVNKDRLHGDILVLCTDGIYSADQTIHGTDVEGDLWMKASPSMMALYKCLRSYFSEPQEEAQLQELLRCYLGDLKDRNLLDDDATVGVIITGAARAHHEVKRKRSLYKA